jgi:Glyoxalase/Bleomycin resistance protein/Dioxygenase superfamily
VKRRLRQVTSIVPSLDAALDELKTELDLSVSRRGDGKSAQAQGASTAFLPIGETFLEVLSPNPPDAPAGHFLDRHEAGGFLVVLQCDDLDQARAKLDRTHTRVAWKIQEPGAVELHLDRRDPGGALLAIDWADPPTSRRWAGAD